MTSDLPLVLDLTRTVSRAGRGHLTGIDRVERAWARHFHVTGRLAAMLVRVPGGVFALPAASWPELEAVVAGQEVPLDLRARLTPRRNLAVRRAESWVRRHGTELPGRLAGPYVYTNVGHANLDAAVFAALRVQGAARIVTMLHDTIPLDHPGFASPRSTREFPARLDAARQSDAVLTVSRHAAALLSGHMRAAGEVPPIHVLRPGIPPVPRVRRAVPGPGTFLCLGTIEPRKNHALLLDIWREFHARLPQDLIPKLDIIGARGWNNAALFRRLDREVFMGRTVFERGPLQDEAVWDLMAGARALLFPSLAEGFGLPVAEALAAGLPVLATDLPALREAGGEAAAYLPPGDRGAWSAAILAASKTPPADPEPGLNWSWDDHFAAVAPVLAGLASSETASAA